MVFSGVEILKLNAFYIFLLVTTKPLHRKDMLYKSATQVRPIVVLKLVTKF